MRSKLIFFASLISITFQIISCATTSKTEEPPPPIKRGMEPQKAVEAALDYGGDTLKKVKIYIRYKDNSKKVERILFKELNERASRMESSRLINAVHLYIATRSKRAPQVFKGLMATKRTIGIHLGLTLAATLPSKRMAVNLEEVLTRAIVNNDLERMFIPELADAILINELRDSYTVLRQGLFTSNEERFAEAMAKLKPKQASYDFMDYLAKAPVEELRQLTQTSVDLYACIGILKHMQNFPVSVSHPNFEHIFYYMISRNNALSELSGRLLMTYLPHYKKQIAFQLARMPTWVQIGFVENARRSMTPLLGLFLEELKVITSQNDVIDEINQIKR